VEAERAGPLLPSSAFDEATGRSAAKRTSAAERQQALQRGRIVHRLMQSLPDIPPPRREDAAARYLAGAAKDFSPAERTELMRQIFAILDARDFAELFAPGSRAEVPIVGRLARPGGEPAAVAGQVDRLIVTDDAVLIADYKTDSVVPRQLAEVPAAYIGQLALYRAVLARLYPEKTVRAAVIFTAAPVFMEIAVAAMDAELSQILTNRR
jgi:ATP-dependent helicase/nuclease subunit A